MLEYGFETPDGFNSELLAFLRKGIKVKRFTGMAEDKVLPYGYPDIDQDDIDIVSGALTGEFLTTGPLVENFETALKNLTNIKYAVTCSSGTAALHLACLALRNKERRLGNSALNNFFSRKCGRILSSRCVIL